jgi:glycine/D-amino acid oxidase-like deaminating enzyme/GNAT superfamily N-acetyltransferase
VRTAAVVGGGVLGLSAGWALAREGYRVTVHEQFEVGTRMGSSSGGSRIFRCSYAAPDYVRLARRAIAAWEAVDPGLLVRNGLLEWGDGTDAVAAAMAACGEPHEWLEPEEAMRRFPEARFESPVLWHADAGAIRADRALARLAQGLDVRSGERVEDPRALDADVVVVATGPWLGEFLGAPLSPRIEEVAYFAGVPEERPSIIEHGSPGGYGVVTPGVGFKLAEHSPEEEFDPDTPARGVRREQIERIAAFAAERFPGVEPRPVSTEACLYTMTPDEDFIVDSVDGIIVCGGDSGHAFKFGPLLGLLVADLAAGRPLPPAARRFRATRPALGLAGGGVQIAPWDEGDLPLLEKLLGDPAMMEHLGGPESREKIAERHARYLAGSGRDPMFKILDGAGGEAVGWVGYWERSWREQEVYEIGWSVLPAYQGRGVASAATAQAIADARSRATRRFLHAFPSVENPPSNGICRKLGFALLGECEVEYPPGSVMRCNDWRLDLRASG